VASRVVTERARAEAHGGLDGLDTVDGTGTVAVQCGAQPAGPEARAGEKEGEREREREREGERERDRAQPHAGASQMGNIGNCRLEKRASIPQIL
jgi:hypothetical protein